MNRMKIKHIYVEGYKVFHNFDIDFTEGEKTQNLIVITGVNGNGKTTLLRDIIADTNATIPVLPIFKRIPATDIAVKRIVSEKNN